jgi:hypothetical protein
VDVWEYFQQKEAEHRDNSLVPDASSAEMFSEEEGSGGKRGRIFGRLVLSERAYLSVHEVVVVENEHVHRETYGYFLVIDGAEAWGYERDPTHDPPEHGHGEGTLADTRRPCDLQRGRRARMGDGLGLGRRLAGRARLGRRTPTPPQAEHGPV